MTQANFLNAKAEFALPKLGRPEIPANYLQYCVLRYRTRRQLRKAGKHILDDIGITEAEARAEASKPFWKA